MKLADRAMHEFNRLHHPECRQGEMWAGNVYEWRKDVHIELGEPPPKFSHLVYLNGVMFQAETMRIGEEAYDGSGNSLASFRPTFIQISEFENKAL